MAGPVDVGVTKPRLRHPRPSRLRVLAAVCVGSMGLITALAGFQSSSARAPLYEPPDGFAYSGMFVRLWDSTDSRVGDLRPFAVRLQDSIDQELAGKPPAILLVPTTWQRADGVPIPFANTLDEIKKFQAFNAGQIVPFIKWNAQSGWDNMDSSYRGITTRDVAQGRLDEYIHAYARDIRDYGGAVFMSPICAEFNGGFWSCGPAVNRRLTVDDFIAAWRRTVDIFRAEGADNVAWVWNPMPPTTGGMDFPPFYPGDDYVDWAGLDMYVGAPLSAIEPAYRFAVARGKPFFLGEWGIRVISTLSMAQQRDWLEGMFDVFESHPKIKAIVYYNYKQHWEQEDRAHMAPHVFLYGGQVNYHPNVSDGDSRLLADSGVGFRATYARRIANPRYLTVVLGRPTPKPTPVPTATAPPPTSTPVGPTGAAARWLVVRIETPALALDGAPNGTLEPGERCEIWRVEEGWALCRRAGDPPTVLVWIRLDDHVEFARE